MNDVVRIQMERCLETELRGSYLLRFPAELEARFERDQREQIDRDRRRVGVLGAILLDLFVCTNYILQPASVERGVIFRFFVFTPWALLVLFLNFRGLLARYREALSLSTVVAGGFCVLAASPLGGPGEAANAVFSMVVVLFFGTLTLALRFSYAAAAAVILMAEGFVYLEYTQRMSRGETLTTCLLAVCSAILALVSNYKAERHVRMSYLLYMREAYRGKSLALQNRDLAELSNADGLTGLANRRYFDACLRDLWEADRRDRFPVSLILLDIDHFKRLNDTFGHPFGDHVLMVLAGILRSHVRAEDIAARYGGEEFAVILPWQDQQQALQIAERLCCEVRETPIVTVNSEHTISITISCGVATAPVRADKLPQALIDDADGALYQAKRGGRDRVCPFA
jgi:diguanylate cyclase (GGDEF)-like protein